MVTVNDDTRSEGDMEDKAAKYLGSQNTLSCQCRFLCTKTIGRLAKAWDVAQGIDLRDAADVPKCGSRRLSDCRNSQLDATW